MKKTLLALACAAAALAPLAAAHAQASLSTDSLNPTSLSAGETGTTSITTLDSDFVAYYFDFLPPTTDATSFLGNFSSTGPVYSIIEPANEAALTASTAGQAGQVVSASFGVTPGTEYELVVSGAPGSTFLANISSTVSAAPEPAAWALMMCGIGGIGMAMRRSRRTVQSAVVVA